MSIRILKFGFLGSILQLLLYWILYKVIQVIELLFSSDQSVSEWAFVLSVGVFGMILLVQNITVAIVDKDKFTRIAVYVSSVLIALAWIEDLNSRPYSTICWISISILTILSKRYIDKFLSYYLTEPNADT